MEKILIVEDDSTMLRVLKDNFEFAGYEVVVACEGEAGLNAALDCQPDLILLDIMLPKISGYEICRLIRKEELDMPIIMLTAKGEESDIILGLNLGADDYVTKPFSMKELIARVGAFLRRRKQSEPDSFLFGDFEFNASACTLCKDGEPVKLSPKEYKLLEYFLKKQGRALTRKELLNAVWGYNSFSGHRTVDRFVTTLRGKIEPNPHRPTFIHTLREIGYKFDIKQ